MLVTFGDNALGLKLFVPVLVLAELSLRFPPRCEVSSYEKP